MNADFMWGIYAGVLGIIIVGGVAIAMWNWWKRKHPYIVTLRDLTTGKPIIFHNLMARKVIDPKLGEYLVTWPRGIILPSFRSEAFNPTKTGGKKHLDVTVKDEYFYENQIREKVFWIFTKKKYTQEQFQELLKQQYRFTPYEEIEYIMNPLPYANRDFHFQRHDILYNRTRNASSFWQKFGAIVFSLILLFAFGISGFMIYQGAQQQAAKMIENAPKCAEIQEQTKQDVITGVADILRLGVPTG